MGLGSRVQSPKPESNIGMIMGFPRDCFGQYTD